MPETSKMMPVAVTKAGSELTVEMSPDDIIDLKGEDEGVTRINLSMGGATVAIVQKFGGGHLLPEPIPDLTEDEAREFIAAATGEDEQASLRTRIDEALSASVDRCARCKVCEAQVDAVMAVLGYPPKNAN